MGKDEFLRDKLLEWRKGLDGVLKLYEEDNVPQEDRQFKNGWGCVSDKEIALLVKFKPKSLGELREIKGFGEMKVNKYGEEIIEIIRKNT
jgi:hypothetical protein